MSDKVAEIREAFAADDKSGWIMNLWTTFSNQRAAKMSEWLELKKYLFATDTSTTSNSTLPWKNSTTLPKLTQLRDNLHSNYLSALFPNDKWLTWQAFDRESSRKETARSLTGYMSNKARESGLRTIVSQLLYDYIDYGNAFVMPAFELRYRDHLGERVKSFIGPVAVRISPEDIVFNPLATSIDKTFKIVRSIKTTGELLRLAEVEPDQVFWKKVVERRVEMRNRASQFGVDDFSKAEMYSVDGFGSLHEYLMSDYIEVMEFFGDYHDHESGELRTNRMITIVDRSFVARDEAIDTYSGETPIRHVGWRKRPDNLWAMGPLDNLVGMQYRIDHLENLKADAMDLMVHPPLKIIGNVENFVWGPDEQIIIDEDGDVQEMGLGAQGLIAATNDIQLLEARMELYAGAPREAMGVRTPGEKTAFEVGALQNAGARIFQEKITQFEIDLLEPHLNDQLEIAHRNFQENDVIAVMDNDLGVEQFKTITKEDITANGKLRPIGARHFAQRAIELQNLIQVFASPLIQFIQPHTSPQALTEYLNDSLDIRGYDIFRPNVGIVEQQETEQLLNQASQEVQEQALVPTDEI